MEVSC